MSRIAVYNSGSVFKLIIKRFCLHVWYAKSKILQNKWCQGSYWLLGILTSDCKVFFMWSRGQKEDAELHHQELNQKSLPNQ